MTSTPEITAATSASALWGQAFWPAAGFRPGSGEPAQRREQSSSIEP